MPRKNNKTINNDSGIYCIENAINKKKYVGRATCLRKRITCHKSNLNNNKDQCKYLQNAWNKYKEENFNFYVLEYCSIEQLGNKEIFWIKNLNTFYKNSKGYNLTLGGEGLNGYSHSSETKNKISVSKTNPTEIVRIRNSNSLRGIKRLKNSSSKYVGVSFDRKNKKWKAKLEFMRKIYWIGRFDTEEEAAKAYNKKSLEICGIDKARLNKIEEYNVSTKNI